MNQFMPARTFARSTLDRAPHGSPQRHSGSLSPVGTETRPDGPAATSTLWSRTGRLARRAWRAYWNWRAREATVRILNSLDRRTLHDIGINPSEIQSFVFGTDGERRRRYLPEWRSGCGRE